MATLSKLVEATNITYSGQTDNGDDLVLVIDKNDGSMQINLTTGATWQEAEEEIDSTNTIV